MEPVIIVHGGAWAIPDSLADRTRAGVIRAAKVGLGVLRDGLSAVEAVEAAVVVLEDDPAFNAGMCKTWTSKTTLFFLIHDSMAVLDLVAPLVVALHVSVCLLSTETQL